jgi:hypothetical protein
MKNNNKNLSIVVPSSSALSRFNSVYWLSRFVNYVFKETGSFFLKVLGGRWPPKPEIVRKYGLYFLLVLLTPLLGETIYKIIYNKKRETTT